MHFGDFLIALRLCFFLRLWHSKIHPKNYLSYLKKVWHQTNLLSLFEMHVNVFNKIVTYDFFCHIFEYFCGNVQFVHCFHPKEHQKIITAFLSGCGILYTCLRPLEYVIRFPTKLLLKLCFGYFRTFLRLCSLFPIFAPHKPPKNPHSSLKAV